MPDNLETLSLDTKTGEFLINGEKVESATYMQLTFDSGRWDLIVHQRKYYGITGEAVVDGTRAVTIRERL